MRRAKAEWSDPMPRGARIAGWVYFPIHVAVLPLTIGVLLMAVLGELPSDVTCNVLYYLIGLVFTPSCGAFCTTAMTRWPAASCAASA